LDWFAALENVDDKRAQVGLEIVLELSKSQLKKEIKGSRLTFKR
jgi:hypothetical protein